MSDHMEKYIAEGKRDDVKLPPGMVDKLSTGKSPALLKQLKQKFWEIAGNPEKVAHLCKEYAPQLGVTEMEVWNLLGQHYTPEKEE